MLDMDFHPQQHFSGFGGTRDIKSKKTQKQSNLDSSMNCLSLNTQNQHRAALKSYFKFKLFLILLLLSENLCFTLYLDTRVDSDEF